MNLEHEEAPKRPYLSPQLNTLSFEQASLFLVGQAWNGDPGARALLELMFPLQSEQPPR